MLAPGNAGNRPGVNASSYTGVNRTFFKMFGLGLLVGNFKFALFVIPPTFAIPSASKLACVLLAPVASYTRKPQPKEWQKSKFN